MKAKSDKAIEDQQEARAAREREVVQARTAAEERKRAAEEAAAQLPLPRRSRPTTWLPSTRILAEAAKRDETSQNSGERAEGRRGCQVKARHAQARRTNADIKRVQADRVEELAGIEKQKRQSERCE